MSGELDPKEVLMHLQELGYTNITPEQLKEFIKDLEMLIQHDMSQRKRFLQSKSPEDSVSSPIPNTTDESVSSSHPPASTALQNHPVGAVEQVSCSSSDSSIAPARRVLRECTKHLSQNQERVNLFRNKSADASKTSSKPNKTCDCAWRRIGCKCCEELMSHEQNSLKTKSKENLAPPRPKSSFIRTWQTQAGSYRTQRCDPVALYQQYQQVWKQQKLPGEDNHNDLRWSVRERLLGQQPLPRSCPCDSKCPCKLNETDFTKQPKKVTSKILPQGPFHIEGRILGPSGLKKCGEYEISERQVRGIFEVCIDSSEEKYVPANSTDSNPASNYNTRKRGVWVSKKDVHKVKETEVECCESQLNESQIKEVNYCMTEEELENRRKNHNRSNCKYCGLIHYVLASSEGSNYSDKMKRNISPVRKADQPTIDLRKDCNEKQDDKINDSHRQVQGKNKTHVDSACDPHCMNNNKNANTRGYWRKQFLENRNARKNIEIDRCCDRRCVSPPDLTGVVNTSREQWPPQFTVQADVHREDASIILSPGSRSTRPTSTPLCSTSDSPSSRSDRPMSTSVQPTHAAPDRRGNGQPVLNLAAPSQRNPHRHSDSYFETRIPITLKDFKGELKTEVEVHKRHRLEGSRSKSEESKNPLVTVATKVKIFKI